MTWLPSAELLSKQRSSSLEFSLSVVRVAHGGPLSAAQITEPDDLDFFAAAKLNI